MEVGGDANVDEEAALVLGKPGRTAARHFEELLDHFFGNAALHLQVVDVAGADAFQEEAHGREVVGVNVFGVNAGAAFSLSAETKLS